jgi:hypothetical protein
MDTEMLFVVKDVKTNITNTPDSTSLSSVQVQCD